MMSQSNIELVRQHQIMVVIKRKRDKDIEKNQKELTTYLIKTMRCFCENVSNNKKIKLRTMEIIIIIIIIAKVITKVMIIIVALVEIHQ